VFALMRRTDSVLMRGDNDVNDNPARHDG
jgi:hypothetical protein